MVGAFANCRRMTSREAQADWERRWRDGALLLPMKRIFHHYEKWECYRNGMWRDITKAEHDELLPKAIEFTGDAKLYGGYMQRVIREWPVTCEQNLSDAGQNRKAFVGHAAACLALGCPEYVTREVWGHLTQQQQDEANSEADRVIRDWRKLHEAKTPKVHRQMGAPRLPARDTRRSSAQTGSIRQSPKLSRHLQRHPEK